MSSNIPTATQTNFRKGDNSEAFYQHFLQIDLEKEDFEQTPAKVVFVTGCIEKTFENPEFPIYVDFTESETQKLNTVNVGSLVAYDNLGRQLTCEGSITFSVRNGVIYQC